MTVLNTIVLCFVASVVIALLLPIRTIRAVTNPIMHPGYGHCFRCGRTWDVVDGHMTDFDDAHWSVITPNDTNSMISMEGVPNDGKQHEVVVTNGEGCFPLCKQCWKDLQTPEARLPYYRMLIDEWKREDTNAEAKWPKLKAAVMAGN